MVSHWPGEPPAVCPVDRRCVQEREGNVLLVTEIPGLEVQAPGSNITFVIIVKSL